MPSNSSGCWAPASRRRSGCRSPRRRRRRAARHRRGLAARVQGAARTSIMASPPFMSMAPRPHTSPSMSSAVEGRMRPFLPVGGHDVGVAVQQQRGRLRRGRGSGRRGWAAPGSGPRNCDVDARLGEQGGDVLGAGALVAGRVDAAEPDQVAQDRDRVDVRRVAAWPVTFVRESGARVGVGQQAGGGSRRRAVRDCPAAGSPPPRGGGRADVVALLGHPAAPCRCRPGR